MIMNFKKQSNINTFSRARGGWCKKVTGVDRTQKGGYSILGEFIKLGNFDTYLPNGLYLDVSKSGRGKEKPDITYHLFRATERSITLIKTLENPENNWEYQFWDVIEEELNKKTITPQSLANMIHEKTTDKEIITELVKILKKEDEYHGFRNHLEVESYMYDIPCIKLPYDYFEDKEYTKEINWTCKELDVKKHPVNAIFELIFKGDAKELGKTVHIDSKEINAEDIKNWEFRKELRKTFGDELSVYFTYKGCNAVGSMNRNIVVMCGFDEKENVLIIRNFDYYD